MRIMDNDIEILEAYLNQLINKANQKARTNSNWWLFILDIGRTLNYLKEIQDPYGEK